jgi:hypothetical protein
LICLFLLGSAEDHFSLKLAVHTYEVTGPSAEEISVEVNRILESIRAISQNVQVAATPRHVRFQFEVEGTRKEQEQVFHGLKHSALFENAVVVGRVQG